MHARAAQVPGANQGRCPRFVHEERSVDNSRETISIDSSDDVRRLSAAERVEKIHLKRWPVHTARRRRHQQQQQQNKRLRKLPIASIVPSVPWLSPSMNRV
jgi:hypothetical protein